MAQLKLIPEEELVARLKRRDSEAFRYLYENYSSVLLGQILKMIAVRETAEDVLQEVFVKIWKNMQSYDAARGRLYTWMMQICRNTTLDKLKSKHEKTSIQNIEDKVYTVDKNRSTQMKVEHIGVRSQLEKLKDEHRILMDLAYYKGYTQEEISDELNIPLGTVKTRMRAAMAELRKIFS